MYDVIALYHFDVCCRCVCACVGMVLKSSATSAVVPSNTMQDMRRSIVSTLLESERSFVVTLNTLLQVGFCVSVTNCVSAEYSSKIYV